MTWLTKKLQEKFGGNVPSQAAPQEQNSPADEGTVTTSSSFGMSVMEAMDQGSPTTPPSLLSSTTPVASTGSSGLDNMGWMLTTAEVLDRDPALLDSLPLDILTPMSRSRLETLSAGRGEPIGATIREIAVALAEDESDLMESSLLEAVEYYLSSY